jgi:acylphosphatase
MSEKESKAIRRTVYFSGSVQGVGFRYTTRHIASRFGVTGFVRNLPDGRVELVAEGDPAEVDRFEQDLQDTMSSYISDRVIDTSPATGQFASFTIAF